MLGCSPEDGHRNPLKPLDTSVEVVEPTYPSTEEVLPVETSGVVSCDAPSRRAEAVFDRTVIGPGDWEGPWEEEGPYVGALGIVVVDLDGDDVLDLFVPRFDYPSELLLGNGDGSFRGVTGWTDVALTGARGAMAADLEGDGDQDIVLYFLEVDPVILRNHGDATFVVEVLNPANDGLPGCGGSASVADLDLDGDLDLMHGRVDTAADDVMCGSWLFVNNGDGSYTNRSDMLSDDVMADRVLGAGWHQLDDDPWPELYIVSDVPTRAPGNRVLDNDHGRLTQVDDHALNLSMEGMGMGVADLNDDGRVDVYVPGIDEYAVMVSMPGMPDVWVDYAAVWGLGPNPTLGQTTAWGGDFADLDNDGLVDLAVVYGTTNLAADPPEPGQPDAIHRQVAFGVWEEVAPAWNWADTTANRAVIAADLDGNGFLDLVKREMGGRVYVDLARCDARSWLVVRLHQEDLNPRAIGASVEVFAGGRRFWRSIHQGSTSYSSGNPPIAHFGLGNAASVDRIEVVWPDGERTIHQGVHARQVIDIVRP